MAQGSWIPEACRWRILSNPKRTCIGLSLLRYLGLVSQLPKWCRIGRVAVLELLPPCGIIRSLTAMTVSCIYHVYRSYDALYFRSGTSPCRFLKPVGRNACRYLSFLLSCDCGRHQLCLLRPAFRVSSLWRCRISPSCLKVDVQFRLEAGDFLWNSSMQSLVALRNFCCFHVLSSRLVAF